MAITLWEPPTDLGDVRRRIDRMFEDMFTATGNGRHWTPAIDVVEDEGRTVVRCDLPGVKPDEFSVEVRDDVLTISGEHEEATEHKDGNYLRRERRWGSFHRSMRLPEGVSADAIEATQHDGVLEVSIPKPAAAEKQEARQIEVKPV